ncbi:LOW QUALITY PROTEIN: E3 ubiquitin-protein ligase RNF14-like, partial [Homalodisca vitripennis]|uniref:LOW QUALITY PROTEIN: E3 ubiquitin-protein ligase RNF14-like n=1 Tax=Homalodisca vitripennis TaxID=197043 RepID=UPI001EEAECC0
FEVGCEIHAKTIGDHNVFEPKCYVGPDVVIGNGCIIGAGCRVTVAEKLPDQTVITGRHCVRSVALDRPPDPDDLARQGDELTAMSEIFTKEEFSTNSTDAGVYAIFEAHVPLPSKFLLLLSKDTAQTDFAVSHLPPLRLIASLPQSYPSQSSPDFVLSCCWLPKHKLDKLVVQLQSLWEENQCEILFIWCSFLKDQSLDLLGIVSSYDLSDKCLLDVGLSEVKCDQNPTRSRGNSSTTSKSDRQTFRYNTVSGSSNKESNNNKYDYKKITRHNPNRKLGDENDFLRIRAKETLIRQGRDKILSYHRESLKDLYFYLIEYNATKTKEEFKKALQECNVCFSGVPGELCKQLSCSHVTCVDCLKRMCEVHIKHGTMESIVCSQENCGLEIPANLIKELVSKELYDQFDRLMLNRTLDKISNMTYCPLLHCQYPIATEGDEALAVCPSCNHAFCIFCKRAYHGIEGCRMKSEEKQQLIKAYQNADHERRLELEKRYGKRQLVELVNTAQTEEWMSENSKKCPCCNVNIEKNDGCNKMICRKCNANFCWMCLKRLSSLNPYLHYQDPKSRCFKLLFEGTFTEEAVHEEDFFDDEEEEII